MNEPFGRRLLLRSRDYRVCAEAGLVLAARGIEYSIDRGAQAASGAQPGDVAVPGTAWWLSVADSDYAEAERELRLYLAENPAAMPGPARPPEISAGWRGVVVYTIVLLVVTLLTQRGFAGFDWLAAGVLDVGRVRVGEVWRVLTALTLHTDLSHLLGNLAFGSFFGHYVARQLGEGVGWAAILLCGGGGNLLNALVQPAGHRSIGASTAVFAALAILSAYSWRRGTYRGASFRTRVGPVVAGIGLLAFTGTGGENTDLIAHLAGFAVGLVVGAMLAHARWIRRTAAQTVAGGLALLSIVAAWAVALAR